VSSRNKIRTAGGFVGYGAAAVDAYRRFGATVGFIFRMVGAIRPSETLVTTCSKPTAWPHNPEHDPNFHPRGNFIRIMCTVWRWLSSGLLRSVMWQKFFLTFQRYLLSNRVIMEATNASGTPTNSRQSTRSDNPEDSRFYLCCCLS
jgi:hypothetical protein